MVVFSPFVPFLCTLWEPSARFFNIYSAFTDQKKKIHFFIENERVSKIQYRSYLFYRSGRHKKETNKNIKRKENNLQERKEIN